MPEPTTRDEHVAEARRLARFASDLYSDDSNDAGPREGYASESDFDEALKFGAEMHRQTLAEMAVWADLAMVHIKIAEVLGQQPAEPVAPVRPWIPNHRGYWQYGPWALIVSSPGGAPSSSGWYLFGPGLGDNGAPMGTADFVEAQRAADEHIAVWLSEPSS